MGLEYIYQAIDVADIRIIVQNAMLESAQALSKKYGVAMGDIYLHITDLLSRFTNAALGDTCARVGGDPARKLSPADRLIGSAKLALEMGITPAYIAVGAASGLHRYLRENNLEQSEKKAETILADLSGMDGSTPLTRMILSVYQHIVSGATVTELRRWADETKRETLPAVI